MSEEEKESKGFKVQDRRRFSSEGEPKAESPEEVRSSAAEAQSSRASERPAEPHLESPPGATRHHAGGAAPEVTFAAFIVGLSTEALALLGEMPHPATGEPAHDLDGAQQLIDILAILRDKTRGNLDADEQALIEAVLYDLRMKYVEKARAQSR